MRPNFPNLTTAPDFWYARTRSPLIWALETALSPLSLILQGAAALRRLGIMEMTRADMPVLCVGNLIAGGGGKTPTVQAIADTLRQSGLAHNPCILSRGFGGRLKGPVRVDPELHTARDVGDEPLLLAKSTNCPVIVSAKRSRGAKFAKGIGADVLIMDDGLQNPTLYKDLKLVVINGQQGFGNRRSIPAGPLRTPLKAGLRDADAVLLIGEDTRGVLKDIPSDKPILTAHITPQPPAISTPVIAFCGIAHPDNFRRTLEDSGIQPLAFHTFPDHHLFTEDDLFRLAGEAYAKGARLITTEKDAARIPSGTAISALLDVLPIRLTLEQPEQMAELLEQAMMARAPTPVMPLKRARYALEALLLKACFAGFGSLKLDRASALGGWIGRTIGPRLAASRKATRNLATAFPDLGEREREEIIKGMWDNLGRVIAEYPHLREISRDRIDLIGLERLYHIRESGKPVIMIGAHIANWEIGPPALLPLNMSIDSVYRPPNNPHAAKLLERCRNLDPRAITIPKSAAGMRQMVERVREGHSIGLLVDQKYNEGIPVPFFGRDAMTSPAFVRMAQKFNLPLIPIRVERLNGAHFRVTLEPSIQVCDGAGAPLPVEDVIETVHMLMEDWIRARPEQWLWLHRRWKD